MEAVQSHSLDIQNIVHRKSPNQEPMQPIRVSSRQMESIADLSQKWAQAYDVADTPENRAKIQDVLFHFQENVPKNETVQHRLQMHADSGRIQVALINFATGEVIEEIPSSKLLDFRHELEKNESLLLEEKA